MIEAFLFGTNMTYSAYITEITIQTEFGEETLEIHRTPGGGLFGIDATFLDQVSNVCHYPFDGGQITLANPPNREKNENKSNKSRSGAD